MIFDRTIVVGLLVIIVTVAVFLILRHPHVNSLFVQSIPDRPQSRLFLASVAFFLTFAGVRTTTYSNYHGIGPFHDIYFHGRHIHHLVWGILILLPVGYGWLVEAGSGGKQTSAFAGRVLSLLFGAGAALTLDEFALWLNLEDVYWAREGRASIDAVILFGSLLLMGVWGGRFLGAALREFSNLLRHQESK
jgi:hypothetical protein